MLNRNSRVILSILNEGLLMSDSSLPLPNTKNAFKSNPQKTEKLRNIFREKYLLESDQVKINKTNFENINNGTFEFNPEGKFEIFEAKYYGIKEYY